MMIKTKLRTLKMDDYILILLTLSLVLVDWRINDYITFSDIMVFMSLCLLTIKKQLKLRGKQLLIYLIIITCISFNLLVHALIDNDFNMETGIISFIKVSVYLVSVIFFSNFISSENLKIKLIDYLNKASIIVSIIGIYIYVSMLFDNLLPYSFLWNFTRSDISSYTYAGSSNIFRMRSIFSEPAHMGFFLLVVLGISYFNSLGYRISRKNDLLFTISLILSFSFSSIVILIILKILNLIKNKSMFKLFEQKSAIMIIPIIIMVMIKANKILKITVTSRIQRIILGEDTSANSRLIGSWSNIKFDDFLIGNGIGNSTNIYNNYAYILSDIGIIGLLLLLGFNLELFMSNKNLFILFILLNFMKSGYLGVGFWVFIMLFSVYCFNENTDFSESS